MEVTALRRVFAFDGLRLPDPGSHMNLEEVRSHYSQVYPDMATATMSGPEIDNGTATYEFTQAVGTKG